MGLDSALPWALLALYGAAFYLLAPAASDDAGFYGGRDRLGREPGATLLFSSVFISWIFAKSVTNAANLAATHGLPGAVAYGAYWLSIPVAGIAIVAIRSRSGAPSLPEWVASRYGRAAAYAFLLAILIRLYNEVWSNSAVVGTYFGPKPSAAFYAGALGFTVLTLLYTLKGGFRSSIFTDALQAGLFALFLAAVVAIALPGLRESVIGPAISPIPPDPAPEPGPPPGGSPGLAALLRAGEWTLAGGLDLLLVALLQSLSYPFHDPVLTDRGFLSGRRQTIVAFSLAGVLGFGAIVLFGLIGLPAFLGGVSVHEDAPRAVAAALGAGALLLVNAVMITSAGSTLDSTFSSVAKALERDARRVRARGPVDVSPRRGRRIMAAAAVLGSVPLFTGATILQATTISGTMVMGLAPIFLLGLIVRAPPLSFHLAFWTGLALGVLEVLPGGEPLRDALAVGRGPYASLLGINAWGLLLVTVLFLLPVLARRMRTGPAGRAG